MDSRSQAARSPWPIKAFEAVAAQHVELGTRVESPLRNLVHRIFAPGAVFAWEVLAMTEARVEQSKADHQA
jgi:hypothetical protein